MRNNARETAFKIVFSELFSGESDEKFRRSLYKKAELGEEDAEFSEQLVSTVREHREELFALIASHTKNYAEQRIIAADKAAMLVALAEIEYFDDIPPVVSVSEAAGLARKYSTEKSADFVNGVLGGIINS